jgi:hypothetical protein
MHNTRDAVDRRTHARPVGPTRSAPTWAVTAERPAIEPACLSGFLTKEKISERSVRAGISAVSGVVGRAPDRPH